MASKHPGFLKPKYKVYAYITHARRLLVMAHPQQPEAGLQVPGGTVEEGENPDDAVMREAHEETGLAGLHLHSFLGECRYPFPEQGTVHHRRYYHLTCPDPPPERWQHFEHYPSDGSPAPIELEFFWAKLPHERVALIGDLDQMVPVLVEQLGLTGENDDSDTP
jgi:8-oxo-dGTP diphosphatase